MRRATSSFQHLKTSQHQGGAPQRPGNLEVDAVDKLPKLVHHLHTLLPRLPEITPARLRCVYHQPDDHEEVPGKKAGHTVPSQVVNPALCLQLEQTRQASSTSSILQYLGHDGINPREASPGLGPGSQFLGVGFPGDLAAYRVAHLKITVLWMKKTGNQPFCQSLECLPQHNRRTLSRAAGRAEKLEAGSTS